MSNHHEFDHYAGIHFRNVEASNINGYANPVLRKELAARGVGTLIIPNAQSYDFESNTVTAHHVRGDEEMSLLPPLELSLDSGLDVVRSRVITPRALEARIPVLNGPRLREIGGSKWRQYEIAGEFMPKTVAIEGDDLPVAEQFANIPGDRLVVKADMSQKSQYFTHVPREEVIPAILGMRQDFQDKSETTGKERANARILVQEYVKGENWPELAPLDEKSAAIMSRANDTELRMYCYVDADQAIPTYERYYASGYAFHDEGGDYFSVEQSSVPQQAWDIADTVSTRILQAAQVPGGYFAVDLFRTKDGQYKVREINTRDPMMLTETENKVDTVNQRKLLAGVMATLAQKNV